MGQEFEWALHPESVVNKNWEKDIPASYIGLTTNSNNDIYMLIYVTGYQKLAFANQEIEIEPNDNGYTNLLIKLDTNKNLIWARKFGTVGKVDLSSICLDENENLLITGIAGTILHSLYLNPESPDPNTPDDIIPTHGNLTDGQDYGFLLRMDSQGII
ncbi:hypothetical protein [Flavobacterium sp. 3HN19-14]|uniref:hypothetical protein n=1 Tax=Flavobacterium sp. 3HN19-14 TaxID=3448133 RepID=UPI003EE1C834